MGDTVEDLAALPPSCENCCSLSKEVLELKQELEKVKKELERSNKLLRKAQFESESSTKYAESLKQQVKQLHEKLDSQKKRNTGLENNEQPKEYAQGPIITTSKDLASVIRETAEQATTNNGFIYDETTGLYFDYSTHYYYDPNTRLYYDYKKGTYYTYDTESDTYNFYSQVDLTATQPKEDTKDDQVIKGDSNGKKDTTKDKKEKVERIEIIESGSEDGEIIEIEDDDDDETDKDEKDNEDEDEEEEQDYPPCIRAIVMKSNKLPVGSLNIITCMGLILGRMEGGGNFLRISDVEVSKEHAKIHYDKESNHYFLTDLASQNGTFINGTRLSETKVASVPYQLRHGEQLTLGSTTFLLHVHPGLETCDECEPGQVQAQIKAKEIEEEAQIQKAEHGGTKSDAVRKKELRRLKKRYMLQNDDHELNSEIAENTEGKYKDRAHVRRKKVGSDVLGEKPDDAPSSVLRPIHSDNIGRVMLEKMGWKDGVGLGKKNTGRTEPVMVPLRETGSGLGYGSLKSIDAIANQSKAVIWKKAQERYIMSERVNVTSDNGDPNS